MHAKKFIIIQELDSMSLYRNLIVCFHQAGCGKSFLLKLLIDAVKYLEMESGDELERPRVLTMAPTANAASIIGGKTIESCLGINPHEKWNYVKPGQERQSQLKFTYENVSTIFLDECSMLGANKLAKMNYQVQSFQEGSAKREFFGKKNIIFGGDLRYAHKVTIFKSIFIHFFHIS